MAAKPMQLGEHQFPTKGKAKEFVSKLLHNLPLGELVDDDTKQILLDLFVNHHEFKEKCGTGLVGFTVEKFSPPGASFSTKGFSIVRSDGTTDGISYTTALSGKARPKKTDVKAAFRVAVEDQRRIARSYLIERFGVGNGVIPCGVTGELISVDDADLDHAAPRNFDAIVNCFLVIDGPQIDEVQITQDPVCAEIEDAVLRERFRAFHAEEARVDLISSAKNRAGKNGSAGRIREPTPISEILSWAAASKN
jgi:hypothetical protein